MALRFGAAVSDRVQVTAVAGLNSLDIGTYLALVYPTSLAGAGIFGKGTSAGGGTRRTLELAPLGVSARVDRATTDMLLDSVEIITHTWQIIGFRWDITGGAGGLWYARLGGEVREPRYGTLQIGSGVTVSNAAFDQMIGVFGAGTSGSFPGFIAHAAISNLSLTREQVQDWADDMRSPLPGAQLSIPLGANGAGTQHDLSGSRNDGTVTGCTWTADPVRSRPFVRRRLFAFMNTPPLSWKPCHPEQHFERVQMIPSGASPAKAA